MENFDAVDCIPVSCCGDQHEPVCKGCFGRVVEVSLKDAYYGFCPTIKCPIVTKRPLRFEVWSEFVSNDSVEKYNELAETTIMQRCYNCDGTGPICIAVAEPGAIDREMTSICDNILPPHCMSERFSVDAEAIMFYTDLKRYHDMELTVAEFYPLLTKKHLPLLLDSATDDHEAFKIVVTIIGLLYDPERKATLLLRYMRNRPHIWTECCSQEHCYRCQTGSYHDGMTCDEYVKQNKDDEGDEIGEVLFVPCPACNITICKGDGCDSMSCFCGKDFGWTEQLQAYQGAQQFKAIFPEETDRTGVDILLGERGVEETSPDSSTFDHQTMPGGDSETAVATEADADAAVGTTDAVNIAASRSLELGLGLTPDEVSNLAGAWVMRSQDGCQRILRQWLRKAFPHCQGEVCRLFQTRRDQSRYRYWSTEGLRSLNRFENLMHMRARALISDHPTMLEGTLGTGRAHTHWSATGMDAVVRAYAEGPDGHELYSGLAMNLSSLAESLYTYEQRSFIARDRANAGRYGYSDMLRRMCNLTPAVGFTDEGGHHGFGRACDTLLFTLVSESSQCERHVSRDKHIQMGSNALQQFLYIYGTKPIVFSELGVVTGAAASARIASTWHNAHSPSKCNHIRSTDPTACVYCADVDCHCAALAGNNQMPSYYASAYGGNGTPRVLSIRIDQLPSAGRDNCRSAGRQRNRSSVFSVGLSSKARSLRHYPFGYESGEIGLVVLPDLSTVQVLVGENLVLEDQLSSPLAVSDRVVISYGTADSVAFSVYRPAPTGTTESPLFSTSCPLPSQKQYFCGVTLPHSQYSVSLAPAGLHYSGFTHELNTMHREIFDNSVTFMTTNLSGVSTKRAHPLAVMRVHLESFDACWKEQALSRPVRTEQISTLAEGILGQVKALNDSSKSGSSVTDDQLLSSAQLGEMKRLRITWKELVCCLVNSRLSFVPKPNDKAPMRDIFCVDGEEDSLWCGDLWGDEKEEEDDDLGFSLFDDGCVNDEEEVSAVPSPLPLRRSRSVPIMSNPSSLKISTDTNTNTSTNALTSARYGTWTPPADADISLTGIFGDNYDIPTDLQSTTTTITIDQSTVALPIFSARVSENIGRTEQWLVQQLIALLIELLQLVIPVALFTYLTECKTKHSVSVRRSVSA